MEIGFEIDSDNETEVGQLIEEIIEQAAEAGFAVTEYWFEVKES